MVEPIPSGYPRVTPYLVVDGAAAAIDFYSEVLGAKEKMRMGAPEGRIGHAELEIGDSVVMLADEHPDYDALAPGTVGGTPVSLMVYVENVDAVFARAIEKGARETQPVDDKFYGDRSGSFEDPFGHRWTIATHVEDVAPDEMERRMEAVTEGQ
jgi:PhnB protein